MRFVRRGLLANCMIGGSSAFGRLKPTNDLLTTIVGDKEVSSRSHFGGVFRYLAKFKMSDSSVDSHVADAIFLKPHTCERRDDSGERSPGPLAHRENGMMVTVE
jgi:hypothetical protein